MKYLASFVAGLAALTAFFLANAAFAQTAVSTALEDRGGGVWRVFYSLDEDFLYETGSALTISLPESTGFNLSGFALTTDCGWVGTYLISDASLLAETGIDQLSTSEVCPGGKPSKYLGGWEFTWSGAGTTPIETHRLVIYDSSFQVVETSTVQVPEPGSNLLALAALSTLLCAAWLVRFRERSNRYDVVASIALVLSLTTAAPLAVAAESVPGAVDHDYTVGNYEVVLTPIEFRRTGQFTFEYAFDVSVTNTGAAAGAALLAIGTSQRSVSVTEGLIALPAMAMSETRSLEPIELAINRQHIGQFSGSGGTRFAPDDIVLCVMPEPVLGQSLPESDPAVATIDQFATTCADPNFGDPSWKLSLPEPPKVVFNPALTYSWSMVTSEGTMKFELLPDHAPQHVAAIIYLVRLGFYDGLDFHRVIEDFVAQGGDPLGTGGGGPGYSLAGEFDAAVTHDAAGTLSTAHSGTPITDGSQFFITFEPTPFLDGIHTITGRLVEGSDVLDAIHALAAPSGCSSCGPSSPIAITGGSIIVE